MIQRHLKEWRGDYDRYQKRKEILQRWEWLLQLLGVLVLRYIGQIPPDAPRWHRRRRDLFAIRMVDESTERPLKAIAAARVISIALKKYKAAKKIASWPNKHQYAKQLSKSRGSVISWHHVDEKTRKGSHYECIHSAPLPSSTSPRPPRSLPPRVVRSMLNLQSDDRKSSD